MTNDPFKPKRYALLITWKGYTQKVDMAIDTFVEVQFITRAICNQIVELNEIAEGSVSLQHQDLIFEFRVSTKAELDDILNEMTYITSWEPWNG